MIFGNLPPLPPPPRQLTGQTVLYAKQTVALLIRGPVRFLTKKVGAQFNGKYSL